MKSSPSICHMLLFTPEAFNFQKLGVNFDKILRFEKHINTIYQRTIRKLNPL